MADIEHFLFNSDYPTDKIVFTQKDKFQITAAWTLITKFINTHIPVLLYADGDYTLPNSTAVYPIDGRSNAETITAITLITFMYQGECWIEMAAISFNSSLEGKSLPYRIWCYYDEDKSENIDISATTNLSGPKIAFTSDNNYPRFIGSGYINQGQSYNHNLGFIPIVKTWSVTKNAQVTMPDGSTAYTDLYGLNQSPYFGNASNYYGWGDGTVQVSDTYIKTYIPSSMPEGDEVPSGVYFRMYRI